MTSFNTVADADADARWELVFNEALRALSFQQSTLDNLRSRATLLTAGAALVSSALGAPSLSGNRWGVASLVAILALGGVLASAGLICAPWWRWKFVSSAAQLTKAVDLGFAIDEMHRRLAGDFETWLNHNERQLRRLQWYFTAGLALLLVEMIAWLTQIALLRG